MCGTRKQSHIVFKNLRKDGANFVHTTLLQGRWK